MFKIFAFLLFFFFLTTDVFASVKVLDGDSIIVDKTEVRLIGIDAPEYGQFCFDEDGMSYNCGEDSKKFLQKIVKDKNVICNKVAKDIYRRDLSECFADGANINVEMLKSGHAVVYKNKGGEYKKAEKQARKARKGLWKGRFMRPEFYRVLKRK